REVQGVEINMTTKTRIQIANAPCSWGVLEFDLENKQAGYEQVLDEIAAAGYSGTELGDWGFMPTDPDRLKDELSRRKLKMVAAYVPVDLSDERAHAEGVDRAVKTARLLSHVAEHPFIVLADENGKNELRTKNAGRIKADQQLADGAWSTF